LSTNAITSSLLSQIVSSPTQANQFATDLNQLAKDLEGGNGAAAEDDYVTLSQDALNGATSSTATTGASGISTSLLEDIGSSSTSSSSFAGDLNQLGSDLANGNVTSAQQDLLNLDSVALNAASAAGSSAASAKTASSADNADLMQAIKLGVETGDNSVVSNAMSELASLSTSSEGASLLSQNSGSFGSSSSSASSSTSMGELMQSGDAFNSGTSTSGLSLLA
jgi:hypothetical protein